MSEREKRLKRLRKKERQRRREKRIFVSTAALASLCIIGVVMLFFFMSQNDSQSKSWSDTGTLQVEVAAPAGGAIIAGTNAPQVPEVLPQATAAATAKPTATPTPIPTASPTPEPTPIPTPSAPVKQAVLDTEPKLTSVTVSAAGDCTLGGDYNSSAHERFDGVYDQYGADYFLANVRPIFETDDFTVINLEGPLTTSKDKRENRQFNFKGRAEYAGILASGSVEVAGLANNHALDFGKSGLSDTAEAVRSYDIGAAGYKNAYFAEANGITVCFMSVTEWDFTTDELKDMVKEHRGNCDVLVVSIHWGEEREYNATRSQVKYGHALIDAGADLVLGTHSHVVGGLELYNGKYIVYGLGNFCFGGNSNPKDKDCMIFQQTFTISAEGVVYDDGISIIPCSVSSKTDTNDYRPTPCVGDEALRVISKIANLSSVSISDIKWSAYMKETYGLE